MVGCDNSTCAYQWFHLDSLGLKLELNHNTGIALIARKYSSFEKRRKKHIGHDINPYCSTELTCVSYSKGTIKSQIFMIAHDT